MSEFTAKNYQITRAPARITLLGDKTKRPEPAQHIIEFPGGALEVSRCEDGTYWAHIIVNRGWASDDFEGRLSAIGEVVDTRLYRTGSGLDEIPDREHLEQIAVLIRPRRP